MGEGEWIRCRDWLLPAMEDTSEADLIEHLKAGTAQLWPGERAAVVTQCVRGPARLHVWLGGGDLSELVSMIPGLLAWARAQGCEYATVHGRKGWGRVLRRLGADWRGDELWKAL